MRKSMMQSTRQHPTSTGSNTSVMITETSGTTSSTNHKVLATFLVLGLLFLISCGGGYQNASPPNQPPFQKSLAQIQVITIAGPSVPIAGTVALSASSVYQ